MKPGSQKAGMDEERDCTLRKFFLYVDIVEMFLANLIHAYIHFTTLKKIFIQGKPLIWSVIFVCSMHCFQWAEK